MRVCRVHLVRLAILTLTLQISAIGSASAALCCGSHHQSAGEMECCKEAGGAAHVCPMKRAPKPGVPLMKACCTSDQHALAALFAFTSLPEPSFSMADVASTTANRVTHVEQLRSLAQPPVSPPPRS
jgi:hypothetical protein